MGKCSFHLLSYPYALIKYSSFVDCHFSGSSVTNAKLGSMKSVLFLTESVKGRRLNILVQNVL
jgi:hypothetical protein